MMREIALTDHSIAMLVAPGAWAKIPAQIAPLRRMQVLNGPSDYAMQLGHSGTGSDMLGRFVRGQRWNRSRAVTDAERARQQHYSAWRFHSVTGMRGISNRSRVRLYQPPLCMRPTRSSFGVSM